MKSLTSMPIGSISILLPVYSYEPVLVSYRFLYELFSVFFRKDLAF